MDEKKTPKKPIRVGLPRLREIAKRLSKPVQYSSTSNEAEAAAVGKEFEERFALLFDRHGLEFGAWEMLARMLAHMHEPGLRTVTAGAKKKWDPETSSRLFFAVEDAKKAHPTWSKNQAMRYVASQKEWVDLFKDKRGNALGPDAVRKACDAYLRQVADEEAEFSENVRQGYLMLGLEIPAEAMGRSDS